MTEPVPPLRLYTFHLYRAGGAAIGLEAFELPGDAEAVLLSFDVLAAHETCHQVDVWEGDRRVYSRQRLDPALEAVLGAGPADPDRAASRPSDPG